MLTYNQDCFKTVKDYLCKYYYNLSIRVIMGVQYIIFGTSETHSLLLFLVLEHSIKASSKPYVLVANLISIGHCPLFILLFKLFQSTIYLNGF